MGSVKDIMKLCRLCLVKDDVNVPIFEDVESSDNYTIVKISSCLPVKVTKDDKLPKKICDGCSYKLDELYQFWTTSVSSEKKLLEWLKNANLNLEQDSINHSETLVKQEKIDFADVQNSKNENISTETQNYIMQQQHLPYQQDFFDEAQASTSSSTEKQPPVKRARRAAAMRKRIPIPPESDEEDVDEVQIITKMEESEDSDGHDITESFNVPSTSNDAQPGPSGVNKSIEAPSSTTLKENSTIVNYSCNICLEVFPNKDDFLKHHIKQYGEAFGCCKCGNKYKTISELYSHLDTHKIETMLLQDGEGVVEEIILNYENDADELVTVDTEVGDTNELLYILDDAQCVNEVVIEEQECDITEETDKHDKPDNFTIVKLEHGYMMPNVMDTTEGGEEEVEEEIVTDEQTYLPAKLQPSTSKRLYSQSKPRAPQPKRRHMVPDFSSTNYTFVSPNEEVDIPHYKCLRCEQLFINKFVFFRHIEKGKCYINSCDVCSVTFNKNSEFYYHYIVEHTDRAICNFCFRTFMYEKNVKEHMLRHLDQFRHRCEECNKGFYTVREYRNHYKNRHMGIRHKCSICGRSFADEYYFKRHLATHAKAVKIS